MSKPVRYLIVRFAPVPWRYRHLLNNLKKQAQRAGKPEWRAMLGYTAELHERSVHPAAAPFPFDWEEIGPGYCYGPAFGHWDSVHQILDVLPSEPDHARTQILNNLENQMQDGLVPGSIWMRQEGPRWSTTGSHPPVWPFAVGDHHRLTRAQHLVRECFEPLVRQIGWFESARKAEGEGFFYLDVAERNWESGVDEGVRFDEIPAGRFACVDATSHVAAMYEHAATWASLLGEDAQPFKKRHETLCAFIQERLFDEETGFFHDIWSVGRPERRHLTFEGMWPMVVGAASPEQARRAIDENLLDPKRFFSEHPISTVAMSDSKFELRLWRGPAWNSMTYWASRGCLRYGRADAARLLLERALEESTRQFELTGTIWEFYHLHGGDPRDVARKPHTKFNTPCPDYLGHNPLIAMARTWEETGG